MEASVSVVLFLCQALLWMFCTQTHLNLLVTLWDRTIITHILQAWKDQVICPSFPSLPFTIVVELGFEPKESGIKTQYFHTVLSLEACGQNGIKDVTGGRFQVMLQ